MAGHDLADELLEPEPPAAKAPERPVSSSTTATLTRIQPRSTARPRSSHSALGARSQLRLVACALAGLAVDPAFRRHARRPLIGSVIGAAGLGTSRVTARRARTARFGAAATWSRASSAAETPTPSIASPGAKRDVPRLWPKGARPR
jgi:hypothetical protein